MKILFGLMLFVSLGCGRCDERLRPDKYEYKIAIRFADGSSDTMIYYCNETGFLLGSRGVLRTDGGLIAVARNVYSYSIIEANRIQPSH